MKRFSRRTTRKIKFKLTPKQAEKIIEEEFTTENGNRIRKEVIFEPQSPNDGTIQFNIKGNRKEVE